MGWLHNHNFRFGGVCLSHPQVSWLGFVTYFGILSWLLPAADQAQAVLVVGCRSNHDIQLPRLQDSRLHQDGFLGRPAWPGAWLLGVTLDEGWHHGSGF